MLKKIFAGLILTICMSASASFISAGKLSEALNGDNPNNQAAGIGYVAGVHDAYRGVAHCAPKEMTLTQAVEIAKIQLAAFPNRINEPADVLIVEMLMKYWPCPKGKSV